MDWVDALHETPDLCGEIEVLDYRAIFIGRYSCVYKGRMRRTDELVAIKVLNPIRGTGLSTMRRKIERERKTWSSLRHPNILPLYGFADDHRLFTPFGAFISPWRARGDLGEFLIEEGEEASLQVRLHLWQDVVAGVDYLHSHHPLVVHGDLKPGNVLINDEGHAQLCDFGLVRVYLKDGHSDMTTASPHCGTERYLAWELVMAGEDAIPTAASDIYATGCIGLETLFLDKPYSRHVTNVRWHMMTDMHAGNPPATRPADLVGQMDSLWEILSWCWERDPLFRPHARVLCTQVATNVLDFEDGNAPYLSEAEQASGPPNSHGRLRGRSPVQFSEDKQSGDILVYDPEVSNFVTAIPSSNGSYDHLSDLGPTVNIHKVGIHGDERAKQGSESNIDIGSTDVEEECSSAAYDDGTSLSTSAPIVEAPGTIRGTPILSDTRLRSTMAPPVPSDPGVYRSRSIVAENATEKRHKFASFEPEISRRMHVPTRWDSIPVWDSHSQLKDRGMRDTDFEKIEAVAPDQSYPVIDAAGSPSNRLASPTKMENFVSSSNGHFGSDMNTSITNIYPVAPPDTRILPFNSLAVCRYPDSGTVSKMDKDHVERPTAVPDYGVFSAHSSKNTDVAEYPSVIRNPGDLRREFQTEISNPVSLSQPDILPRGSRASLQRQPLPKPPGGIVHQHSKMVESMNSLTPIPAVNQITLTQEGLPSEQSDSEMGSYSRHSRQLSGGSNFRLPAMTYALPAHRRPAMSRDLSKPASPPTSTSTSHSPTTTAPISGSLDTTPIMERSYGALGDGPDLDAQASMRGSLFTSSKSSELAAGVLIEPSKPTARRIHYPTSLQLDSSGNVEDHAASFMGTNWPKSPASPAIPANTSFATPRTHHISASPPSRVTYLSSSPITTEKLVNAQLPPASTIPPLRPPRNPARLHATAIGPKTGESHDTMGEQRQQRRDGVFSMLRPKHFSTIWSPRPKSLLLSPPSSETLIPLEASPSARRGTFGPFGSKGASFKTQLETLGMGTYGETPATRYSVPSHGSTPLQTKRASEARDNFSDIILSASASNGPARASNAPHSLTNPSLIAPRLSLSSASTIFPFSRSDNTANRLPPPPQHWMGFPHPSVHFQSGNSAARELNYKTFSGDDDYVIGETVSSSFGGDSGVSESSGSIGVQDWADVSIVTAREDAENFDDGSGAAWQQRERERDETEAEERQAMSLGRSANSPRYLSLLESPRKKALGSHFSSFRSSRPGVSFDLLDPQRKEENYDDDVSPSVGRASALDPLPILSPPIHSNSRENDLRNFMRVNREIYNSPVNAQSPIPAVDRDERKEVCTVCHITIRAQNMERHKRSRHPKHFA